MTRATLLILLLAGTAFAGDYEKLSPFTAVRWQGDAPLVELDGRWYRPLVIGGKEVKEILLFCRKTWPGKWKKRFEEDLVEVLTRMGHAPGREVDLVLFNASQGEDVRMDDVPMTEENRLRIWKAADGGGPRGRGPRC